MQTHIGTIEEAIEIINQFRWYVQLHYANGVWQVTTGEGERHPIFSSPSKDEVDTFLYGMAMAYNGIPGHLFDRLAADVGDWYDEISGKKE